MSRQQGGEFRSGLTLVYAPPAEQNAAANVVLVHGLFGHPWKTWADETAKHPEKSFWPKILLPEVIPDARIYSFGYDADIGRFMSAAGLNTVFQHGTNLLGSLADLVEETDSLPILFVVHSLGGLVLKEALNQSSTRSEARMRRAVECTRGIVFLGTPHRGCDTASYGKIVFTLAKIFSGQSANTKLLRALEKDSEILERISKGFFETWELHKQIHIKSFFEEKEIRKLGFFGMRIVSPDCASIGHVREETGSIPADHRFMAKYSSPNNPGFKEVSKVLKRWVRGIKEELSELSKQEYMDCLNSLDDPDARVRVQQVTRTHKVGLDWLFSDQVPFLRWLTDQGHQFSPLFWITGKPGSGKSTAMKFAMEDRRLTTLLPKTKVIGYFFHLRGQSLAQKSFKGMLTEILYQLLACGPHVYREVAPLYDRLLRSQRKKRPNWDIETLQDAIITALTDETSTKNPNRTRYIFFIDALDENADQSENKMLLSFIRRMEALALTLPYDNGMKICLTSRPWPIFQKELGSDTRVLSFAIHDFTKNDIETYTRRHLLQALPAGVDNPLSKERQAMTRLAEEVSRKAHGVFVWVRLVVEELARNVQDGTAMAMLEQVLSRLPDELEELYEYTMKRIRAEFALESAVACRILLSTLRPLTLEALYCATLVAIYGSYHAAHPAMQASWLRSRTGGLIEETETAADTVSETAAVNTRPVQLIHQTAAEFVRKGMPGLSPTDADTQAWVEEEGSVLIFRAIAAKHPPFPPLRDLAQDFFDHVRRIDLIIDRDEEYPRTRLSALVPLRPSSTPPIRSGDDAPFSSLYSEIEAPIGVTPRFPLDWLRGEELDRLLGCYMTPADAERFRSIHNHEVENDGLGALVLLGVRNINWRFGRDRATDWIILGLAALGCRLHTSSNTLRLATVKKMFRHYPLTGMILEDSHTGRVLLHCLLLVSDSRVDDAARLEITKLVLRSATLHSPVNHRSNPYVGWDVGLELVGQKDLTWVFSMPDELTKLHKRLLIACGPGQLLQNHGRSWEFVRLSIPDFCVRFKDRNWVDGLFQYFDFGEDRSYEPGGVSIVQRHWLNDIPAVIVTANSETASRLRSRLYRALPAEQVLASDPDPMDPYPAINVAVAGMAFAGLVLGALGVQNMYRATYYDSAMVRSGGKRLYF